MSEWVEAVAKKMVVTLVGGREGGLVPTLEVTRVATVLFVDIA